MGDTDRVLALDLGTSSVRALVTDGQARPLPDAAARRRVELRVAADGQGDLDADAIVDAISACIDELHEGGHLGGVGLAAVSCFWHSLLGVDQAGRPVTAVLTWADARATEIAAAQRDRVDAAALHRRTGALPHATYWTAKAPWLLAQSGTAPHRLMGMSEYLTARLLDDGGASVSMASGTGLLDLNDCDWDAEAVTLAGVTAAQVPPVLPRGWAGRLGAAARRRWPDLAGARWTPVLGDGAAANLGAGAADAGRVAVTVGTSAAIRMIGGTADAPLERRLWRYRVDHDRVITGSAYSAGGNLHQWARDTLALSDQQDLDAALAEVPPGGHGVTVLPYHAGSRPPLDLPGGSGVIAGLSLATRPVEILAATLEAVGFSLADGYDALCGMLDTPPAVLATGGGLRASAWLRQTLADVLDRPVRLVREPEASARGAAAASLGIRRDPETDGEVLPRPDGVAARRAARDRQAELARQLGLR